MRGEDASFTLGDGARSGSDDEPWLKLNFDLDRYPFPALAAKAIGHDDLTRLSVVSGNNRRWTRQTDQSSIWHQRFYEAFPGWREIYDAFVTSQVAPLFGEPVYYQAIPTFRVHLPDNVAVGEFHTDGQYHHPEGEITFWLPLTPTWDTNSVWVEARSGQLLPFTASPGDVIVFNAVGCRHGNMINKTGQARVSFDFRCLPVRVFRPTDERSVNVGLRFVPGEYYHSVPAGGDCPPAQ